MLTNLTNAAAGYAANRAATAPDPSAGGDSLGARLAGSFSTTLRSGETTALQAMSGAADPHSLVQAVSESKLAVDIAVTVRDKVVEAYQEILRMPV